MFIKLHSMIHTGTVIINALEQPHDNDINTLFRGSFVKSVFASRLLLYMYIEYTMVSL